MEFDEDQVNDLAQALFADAVKPGQDGITVDDLSDQFKKHKGLLENLTLSIGSPTSIAGSLNILLKKEIGDLANHSALVSTSLYFFFVLV